MNVQGYAVRGVKVKGEPSFKEKFTLYFARDGRSTPVAIAGKQGMIRLTIEAVSPAGESPKSGSAAR